MEAYQQRMARFYNKNVKIRTFAVRDMVLQRVFPNTMIKEHGKFNQNWEGPYIITKEVGQGAYRIANIDGCELPNSWNAMHLKLYHA